MNTMHSPLKNKNWLFTETGKEGFHYDDVSNAVVGLKKDVIESDTDVSVEKFVSLVEKWFPDITERRAGFLDGTVTYAEKNSTISERGTTGDRSISIKKKKKKVTKKNSRESKS